MATEGEHYYIGVLPKSPYVSNELIDLLVQKFRDFRLQALSEADGTALGRSESAAERKRTEKSYYDDLTSPTDFWFTCFVGPAGLNGDVFRNVSQNPNVSHIPDTPTNADDERVVKEGRWIGLSAGRGPKSSEEWNIKRLHWETYPDDVESRFHLDGLYFLEGYRGVKLPGEQKLFLNFIKTSFDYLERWAYKRAKRHPAYLRLRGTITPAAVGTKLMQLYLDECGYHIIGWVPQVTAMLLNGAKVEKWPDVEDNVDFYTACHFPTFEKLTRIDKDGVHLLSEITPRGEVWTSKL